MKPSTEQQSLNTRKSTEQQPLEEKQLTLEELASVAGGAGMRVTAIRMEDRYRNKGEVD